MEDEILNAHSDHCPVIRSHKGKCRFEHWQSFDIGPCISIPMVTMAKLECRLCMDICSNYSWGGTRFAWYTTTCLSKLRMRSTALLCAATSSLALSQCVGRYGPKLFAATPEPSLVSRHYQDLKTALAVHLAQFLADPMAIVTMTVKNTAHATKYTTDAPGCQATNEAHGWHKQVSYISATEL
eukprot:5024572-Amphidinium_carterae.1